jgi:hypothetical protein
MNRSEAPETRPGVTRPTDEDATVPTPPALPTSPAPQPGRTRRLAAGRARALGLPTRGTTAPNRLRRVDRWLTAALGPQLTAGNALVVDLGFGASPVTTVELSRRLRGVNPRIRVVGLEIDPERVAAAERAAAPPQLTFAVGGFELAGLRPTVVRALNVLRQYDESAVAPAWERMCLTGAAVVEGTCDELGRLGAWVALSGSGPQSLTLALDPASPPAEVAARLPKALIHRNVAGEGVHRLLAELDSAWRRAAPLGPLGPRHRLAVAVERLRRDGWPLLDGARRWRRGELTVAWRAVAPAPRAGGGNQARSLG